MGNRFLAAGALSGFICVAFGAFAGHAPDLTGLHARWIDTGWRYQAFHTIALLALGFFVSATQQTAPFCRKSAVNIIGILWSLGILLFSFTLYIMALTGNHHLRIIVPVGGVSFLAGWLVLTVVAFRNCFSRVSEK